MSFLVEEKKTYQIWSYTPYLDIAIHISNSKYDQIKITHKFTPCAVPTILNITINLKMDSQTMNGIIISDNHSSLYLMSLIKN